MHLETLGLINAGCTFGLRAHMSTPLLQSLEMPLGLAAFGACMHAILMFINVRGYKCLWYIYMLNRQKVYTLEIMFFIGLCGDH